MRLHNNLNKLGKYSPYRGKINFFTNKSLWCSGEGGGQETWRSRVRIPWWEYIFCLCKAFLKLKIFFCTFSYQQPTKFYTFTIHTIVYRFPLFFLKNFFGKLGTSLVSGFWELRFWVDPKVARSNPGRAVTFLHFFKNPWNFYKNHISRGKKSRGTRIRR